MQLNGSISKVLIVDDDADMCEYMVDIATDAGLHAWSLTDPTLVEVTLRDNPPDILVLDLSMPQMDGIEVLRLLTRLSSPVGVIIVSGYDAVVLGAASQLAQAQKLNLLGTLSKPIRAADLTRLLTRHATPGPKGHPVAGGIRLDELQRALDHRELVVFYQPQVSMQDGSWTGIEALVRWNHPTRGLLAPDRFLDLIDEAGLITKLTDRVIEIAIESCGRHSAEMGFTGTLSINLPPSGLTDLSLPDRVISMCAQSSCKASTIQFEVTESSVPPDPQMALDILTRLRLKGLRLSIDDFGTGHSSLEQLQLLPFNELKIDMGFVRAARSDLKARAIVQRSIQLGKDLGMVVLAEGVETEWHWHWLREAGCDLAQGELISRAIPGGNLAAWHQDWNMPNPWPVSI